MPRQNKIVIRNGTTTPSAADFDTAEPAWDKTAGKLYIKDGAGSMKEVGAGPSARTDAVIPYITSLGYNAANSAISTTYNVTAIGWQAAYSTTGRDNVAIGRTALYTNSSGEFNIGIGTNALYYTTTGTSNIAIGSNTLLNHTNGTRNVAVGQTALSAVTTGTDNTAIGVWAGDNLTTGSNNIVIGKEADASSSTVSNEITLGNTSITTLRCNTQTISSLSDARDKTDVEDLPAGLSFIDSLRPVKFKWETRDGNSKDGTYEAGFIAQDLQAAQSDAAAEYLNMVMDENPDRLEARYGQLIPVLVQAIKELKSEVEQLKANAPQS